MNVFLSKLTSDSAAFNTLNVRTVDVFFQTSPLRPNGDTRGISDLEYQVVSAGVPGPVARTASDGKAQVRVVGSQSELRVLSQGIVVASYTIIIDDGPWEAADTIIGVQRRLRALGYQLGHGGAAGDGISGQLDARTDKAILDFQIDQNLPIDGKVTPETRTRLNSAVGGTAATT